jgi:hypothetical protein
LEFKGEVGVRNWRHWHWLRRRHWHRHRHWHWHWARRGLLHWLRHRLRHWLWLRHWQWARCGLRQRARRGRDLASDGCRLCGGFAHVKKVADGFPRAVDVGCGEARWLDAFCQ